MIDHTGLNVSDPIASRAFYDNALAPLGYKMMVQIPKEHTGGAAVFGYGVPPKPDFWVNEGTPNAPRVRADVTQTHLTVAREAGLEVRLLVPHAATATSDRVPVP